jgi:hypothetical protein
MPFEHMDAPSLLHMLSQLLYQSAAGIENRPEDRSPEQAASSVAALRGIAARADYLAMELGR